MTKKLIEFLDNYQNSEELRLLLINTKKALKRRI